MNNETYESLKNILKFVRGDRKGFWLKRNDIKQVQDWLDETAKEHEYIEHKYTCEGCGAFPQGFKGMCDSCLGKNED